MMRVTTSKKNQQLFENAISIFDGTVVTCSSPLSAAHMFLTCTCIIYVYIYIAHVYTFGHHLSIHTTPGINNIMQHAVHEL